MRHPLAIIAVLLVSSFLLAGEPLVVQELRADLVGKTFTLSTDVASYSCIYSASLDFPTNRLVDTEISPNGGKQYYLRADRITNVTHCPSPVGRTPTMSGDYIDGRYISRVYNAGHRVSVKMVEAKPDRIEIQLTPEGAPSGDDSYSKVKLMLGKGYESSTLEAVETVLSLAIHIPRFESFLSLRTTLSQMDSAISDLEQRLKVETMPESRLRAATALRSKYPERSKILGDYNAVAFKKQPEGSGAYRTSELDLIISDAQARIKAAETEARKSNYVSTLQVVRQSCSKLVNTPAKSLSELEARAALLNAVSADLRRYSSVRQELLAIGISTSSEDGDTVSKCSENANEIKAAIEKQRPELVELEAKAAEARRRKQIQEKLASLRGQFLKLKQEKSALDAKLMTTLGGTAQAEVFEEYRVHLGRMIANRQQAVDLGDQTAELELSSLQNDLRKLR